MSAIGRFVTAVQSLRDLGLTEPTSASVSVPISDPRWLLLGDLHARAHPNDPPWSPLAINATRSVGFAAGNPPATGHVVEIRMDFRLNLGALVSALRENWGLLQSKGLLRRSRPLGERNLMLLRHVCLDHPPGTPWKDLLRRWNDKWSARAGWVYKDSRALQTAFHRAEEELSGVRQGLAWHYDPFARMSVEDLELEAKKGTAAAVRRRKRRHRDGLESAVAAGIWVEYLGAAGEPKRDE